MRPLPTREEIARRLGLLFPRAAFDPVMSGPLASAAVAAMMYVDAVHPDGDDATPHDDRVWARPSTVLWMSDEVYAQDDDARRAQWRTAALGSRPRKSVEAVHEDWGLPPAIRWYADNSRETLRDETFAKWRQHGALVDRPNLPKTSDKPRWALTDSFADLFDPALQGQELSDAIDAWRDSHMAPGEILRISTLLGRTHQAHEIAVRLPDGEVRRLEPGDASRILRGVFEEWAPARLFDPVVVTISEPGDKVYLLDAARLRVLGVTIDPQTLLPDAVIADIGASPVVFWIVEVAASDGVVDEGRRARLLHWAREQRIPTERCEFLTAFMDRNSPAAKRRLKDLAVGTYAWFATEPTRELAWYEMPE